MPALVNISVGSCRGTSGLEGTTSCSFLAKKSRKAARMSLVLAWPRLVWLTLEEAACSVLAVASLALAPLSLATFALVCLADVIGSLTGDLVLEGTGAVGAWLVRPSPKRRS